MSMTHTPAHSTHHPDRFEDETTGLGYDVFQDTDAEDPRSWIGDDEKVAVYVFNGARGDKDADVPGNVAAQAFARFYELYKEDVALALTKRWLRIFRKERYDLAMRTIRGYSQGDWAEVFAASVIDHEDGTPGYGTAQGHIDQYASWRWGDVWTVSPDEGDSLSGIYAASAEEALERYLEYSPPAAPAEADVSEDGTSPDFEAPGIARWHTSYGAVVADTTETSRGVYLHPGREDQRLVEDPDRLVAALAAAAARVRDRDQKEERAAGRRRRACPCPCTAPRGGSGPSG